MASAEAVAAVIAAGGAHVPGLMDELEDRLQELARSHGSVLAEHASATIAAGGKRLRPLLVLLAAGPSPAHPERVLRAFSFFSSSRGGRPGAGSASVKTSPLGVR